MYGFIILKNLIRCDNKNLILMMWVPNISEFLDCEEYSSIFLTSSFNKEEDNIDFWLNPH
jgi:hypothetical protein